MNIESAALAAHDLLSSLSHYPVTSSVSGTEIYLQFETSDNGQLAQDLALTCSRGLSQINLNRHEYTVVPLAAGYRVSFTVQIGDSK